jgi:hypothetical protein
MVWAQVWHRYGPRAFDVEHTSRSAEPHSQQEIRSNRERFWDKRATRQVMMSPPFGLKTDGEFRQQYAEKTDCRLFTIAQFGRPMDAGSGVYIVSNSEQTARDAVDRLEHG